MDGDSFRQLCKALCAKRCANAGSGALDVCNWHKPDITLGLNNVGFWGAD
jgi:hypothetical protein